MSSNVTANINAVIRATIRRVLNSGFSPFTTSDIATDTGLSSGTVGTILTTYSVQASPPQFFIDNGGGNWDMRIEAMVLAESYIEEYGAEQLTATAATIPSLPKFGNGTATISFTSALSGTVVITGQSQFSATSSPQVTLETPTGGLVAALFGAPQISSRVNGTGFTVNVGIAGILGLTGTVKANWMWIG